MRLFSGWNLCSLAVRALNASEQIGIGTDPSILSVYRWEPETNNYTLIEAGGSLDADTPFWIETDAPKTLKIVGDYTDPVARSIPDGGGYAPATGLEAAFMDHTIPDDLEIINVYDSFTQSWRTWFSGLLNRLSSAPPAIPPGASIFLATASIDLLPQPPPENRIQYYHQDHLGSSNILANASGEVLEESAFYPYGSRRNIHESLNASLSIRSPYLFTQKERDAESQFDYFGARYYDSVSCRWLSRDPALSTESIDYLSQEGNLNAYAYVGANPFIFIDPNGRTKGSAGVRRSTRKTGTIDRLSYPWGHIAHTSKGLSKRGRYMGSTLNRNTKAGRRVINRSLVRLKRGGQVNLELLSMTQYKSYVKNKKLEILVQIAQKVTDYASIDRIDMGHITGACHLLGIV